MKFRILIFSLAGIAAISYQALQTAGFPVSTTPSDRLQLFHQGSEVAIQFDGDGDSSGDSSGRSYRNVFKKGHGKGIKKSGPGKNKGKNKGKRDDIDR